MVEIVFSEVDIYRSEKLKSRVAELVASELGGTRSADAILRTIDFASGTTRVIGGFVADELVSMNAFMRMGFSLEDQSLTGFQSGFSATDSSHRGKGYWPKLMTFAEKHLAEKGGSFIFGFPNPVSHPLFTKKLGYTSLDFYNLRIACVPLLFDRAFMSKRNTTSHQAALHPDFDDNANWKMRADEGRSVVIAEEGGGSVWGKVRRVRKLGLPVDYLEIGTLNLPPGGDLKRLFRSAARKAGVRFIYVSMNPENEFFCRLRFQEYGQPVIIKSLEGFDLEGRAVNFFGGMRDTF